VRYCGRHAAGGGQRYALSGGDDAPGQPVRFTGLNFNNLHFGCIWIRSVKEVSDPHHTGRQRKDTGKQGAKHEHRKYLG
ncbi:MAG: hypothetical protein WAU34_09125, partial [Desulfobacterales bacterium]